MISNTSRKSHCLGAILFCLSGTLSAVIGGATPAIAAADPLPSDDGYYNPINRPGPSDPRYEDIAYRECFVTDDEIMSRFPGVSATVFNEGGNVYRMWYLDGAYRGQTNNGRGMTYLCPVF